VVHDGGLLMLLPFLLRKHKTWKNTKLRLFTIASITDNSLDMQKDLEKFLYQLRIEAQVFVIEMPEAEITAYTYERTMKMEERSKLLKEMHIAKKDSDIQAAMDEAITARKISKIHEDDLRKFSLSKSQEEEETAKEVGNKVRFSENSVEVRIQFLSAS
jgi:solute carrier family 12 (potassium/chloride transporter), member 4/6